MGYQLNLSKKSGFKVTEVNQPIIIKDHRGILFFTNQKEGPKVREFNLPKGTYMVQTGYFTEKMFPVKYSLIKLPFPQRFFPEPDDFKVVFLPNPNKCTIDWNNKTIIFDTSFREKPLYEIFFILFHEYGHHLYRDENLADQFAANKMLKYGFNPVQTGSAPLFSLSDRQMARKEELINKINTYVRST